MTEQDYFEYNEDDAGSWKFKTPPRLPDFVQKTLIDIAGTLPDGRPRLRCVWGGTVMSESSETPCLKYSCGYSAREVTGYQYQKNGEWYFSPTIEDLDALIIMPVVVQDELGLTRWVIERYVGPEELEQAGRFQTRSAKGDAAPTLRSFPREGIYEPFLIVQTLDKKYRDVSPDVLSVVSVMWKFSQLPFEEQERLDAEAKKGEAARNLQAYNEMWRNLGDIKLPDEEIDRRNLINEVLTHNAERNAILDQRVTFYNNYEHRN